MRTITEFPTQIAQSHSPHRTPSTIAAAVAKLVMRLLRQWKTEDALSNLSDRELQDIGVHRSDIATVSERAARQPHGRDIPKL